MKADRHPQREILSPLEASLDHLQTTPPSHIAPQKVKGSGVGLLATGRNDGRDFTLTERFVKIILGIEGKIQLCK